MIHKGVYHGVFCSIDDANKIYERLDDISIYGQESNQTTYRLARMNLAIRGIDGSQVKWNNEDSFLRNAHPDLKADFVGQLEEEAVLNTRIQENLEKYRMKTNKYE